MPATTAKETTKSKPANDFSTKAKDKKECSFCGTHNHIPDSSYDQDDVSDVDRYLHATLNKLFGISPGAVSLAYFDWMIHLALSPGKQSELAKKASEKSMLFANYLANNLKDGGNSPCCIHPSAQDRAFADEGWKQWPFNLFQQSFLLTKDWWNDATNNVRGVSQHHADIVPFLTGQVFEMLSPTNFPSTNPQIIRATLEQKGQNLIRGFENFCKDIQQQQKGTPPAGAENYIPGKHVAITEGKVVYRNKLIELIQYSPTTDEVHAEPLLIVPAWIMKYYILDLSPENSLVKHLVDNGHTVFMISWKNPDATYRDFGFEDYVNQGTLEAINAISTIVPGKKIHTAGYCLGGTLLSITAAHMAKEGDKRLASITMLAAQVDFEEAGELLLFIDESQLAYLEDTMWQQGYLDAGRMAGAFQMLRSYDLIWSRMVDTYMLGKESFMNDLMAWNADTTRMPYKMHSEYLRNLFLNNDLSSGHFMVNNKPVALTDITAPIFAVSTQRDHVSPWQSVYKINLYTDTDVTFVLASGGHNAGIVSEPGHPRRNFQLGQIKHDDNYIPPDAWKQNIKSTEGSWWPSWRKWLVKHSSSKTKPPTIGAPQKGYKVVCDAPGKYIMEK